MLLKRIISISALLTLCSSSFVPLVAFAEDSEEQEVVSEAETDVPAVEVSAEVEDEVDEVDENVTSGEGEVEVTEEGTTVTSEEVSTDDYSEEMTADLEDVVTSNEAPDQFYLAVMWGYFGSDRPDYDPTTWTGAIHINNEAGEGVTAAPVKTLMFERQEDSIDFSNTSANETAFTSTILNRYDGILLKVRTDLESSDPGKLAFTTAYSNDEAAAYLKDIVDAGSVEFSYGDYKVVIKVMTREEWLNAHSKNDDKGRFHPKDTESGSWYEQYMNYTLDKGIFSGYKNANGQATGEMGPNDTLTRLQLLKVAYELSVNLDMGAGATGCDASTVSTTSATDWLSDNWARGYVQCIEDSGVSVTMLDTIDSDLTFAGEPALRWEVIATLFEMLGIDPSSTSSDLTDVSNSGLSNQFQSMIDTAVSAGILSGYPDHSFKPFKTVNRAEMFKIVTLFLEVYSL